MLIIQVEGCCLKTFIIIRHSPTASHIVPDKNLSYAGQPME
jgi:hypothetical protein